MIYIIKRVWARTALDAVAELRTCEYAVAHAVAEAYVSREPAFVPAGEEACLARLELGVGRSVTWHNTATPRTTASPQAVDDEARSSLAASKPALGSEGVVAAPPRAWRKLRTRFQGETAAIVERSLSGQVPQFPDSPR